MGNEKSRFLKRDDGTVYDSVTSVTWMANDSHLDLGKEVSYSEAEEYKKNPTKKRQGGTAIGVFPRFMKLHPFMIRKN